VTYFGEDVSPDREEILRGPKVHALLSEQRPVHPYRKWYGAHWRLVSLVELAVPATEPRALAALESILGWSPAKRIVARSNPSTGLPAGAHLRRATRLRWRPDDVLAALLLLGRAGKASDSRAADAIAHLRERQHADGRLSPGGYWWSAPGANGPTDIVDWGRSGLNEMITLNALSAIGAGAQLR
jgi:hypothetical protein